MNDFRNFSLCMKYTIIYYYLYLDTSVTSTVTRTAQNKVFSRRFFQFFLFTWARAGI